MVQVQLELAKAELVSNPAKPSFLFVTDEAA
jgi:hypothetical protein